MLWSTLLCLATLAVACRTPAPIPPVSPSAVEYAGAGLLAGLAVTSTPSPGPSPTATAGATRVVPPPEPLEAPPHFGVGVFADEVGPVRSMVLDRDGDLLVSVPDHNAILVLPDRDHDGVADRVRTLVDGPGLNRPYGLAVRPGHLYVANTDGVVRLTYDGETVPPLATPEMLLPLPGEGVNPGRAIIFGPDGGLYVAIGSSCNACVEDDVRRASILRTEPDGTRALRFATGLRNPLGLAAQPDRQSIWATDNERDLLGDDYPPDELNLLVPGAHYGWPYCWGKGEYETDMGADATFCAGTVPPVVELPAHVTPTGMAFYTGRAFPQEYRGGLFLALHGSWSRELPVGFSVVFLPFLDGSPTGEIQPFVQGWLRPDTRRWGSPADVLVASDGALLVSDDGGGRIYRVYYDGPLGTPTPAFSR